MKKTLQSAWELVKFVLITLAIVIPIRAYVAEPFIVSGESMVPAFRNGQYLVIDELSYHLREPARGEVVIFRYPRDPSKFFIKRLIGLPGETVVIRDNQVYIHDTTGQEMALKESYLPVGQILDNSTTTLGEGEYFVMGDNRRMSLDSRAWGAVPVKNIKGRVFLRLFPLQKIGVLPEDAAKINP